MNNDIFHINNIWLTLGRETVAKTKLISWLLMPI